jgi:hypothetical protein
MARQLRPNHPVKTRFFDLARSCDLQQKYHRGEASNKVLALYLMQNPDYTHLPIPAKRFDVKGIESSRNLSAMAWFRQLAV